MLLQKTTPVFINTLLKLLKSNPISKINYASPTT
jgi:hypothetical protein